MKRICHCLSILFLILCITGCRIESVKKHDSSIQQQEEKKQDTTEKQGDQTEKAEKSDDAAKEETKENKSVDGEERTKKERDADARTTPKEESKASPKTESSPKQEESKAPSNTQTPPVVEEPKISYVTISIDVKTILSNMGQLKENKRAYVPGDGWILAPVKVEIQEGDTVFTVLEKITRRNRIAMEYQGASANAFNTVYIQGIAQLYEFDCGNLSGWMYFVNGNYINVGASAYKVSDGDVITWRYTCDSGKDIANGAS